MLKIKETIPAEAKRLCKILKKKGFSKDNPLKIQICLTRVIDLPGLLDFDDWDTDKMYPQDDKVVIVDEAGQSTELTNTKCYSEGYEVEEDYWNGFSLEKVASLAHEIAVS